MTWKRVASIVALWFVAGVLVAGCLVGGGGRAEAHDGEGAVAVCNWENFEQYGHGGLNWRWVACNHGLHTGPPGDPGEYHSQWRHGLGTPDHTVAEYKREARAFRAYTGLG